MKAIVGSDHAGINGRKNATEVLRNRGWDVEERGPATEEEKADYPDIAHQIATAVTSGEAELGVLYGHEKAEAIERIRPPAKHRIGLAKPPLGPVHQISPGKSPVENRNDAFATSSMTG